MIFNPEDDEQDNGKNDFFDGPDLPEPVKEPKKPTYKPDDPAYWEEESEWEHLKPRRRIRLWFWGGGILLLFLLILGIWLRFLSPYIEDASQVGYVESIERRGTVFKTYEGVLLPYKELIDTTRVYRRDFIFTAADDKSAIALKQAMFRGRPVRVMYKQYHAIVPWRGSSKIVVTAVDSVDPKTILPPEFRPGGSRYPSGKK